MPHPLSRSDLETARSQLYSPGAAVTFQRLVKDLTDVHYQEITTLTKQMGALRTELEDLRISSLNGAANGFANGSEDAKKVAMQEEVQTPRSVFGDAAADNTAQIVENGSTNGVHGENERASLKPKRSTRNTLKGGGDLPAVEDLEDEDDEMGRPRYGVELKWAKLGEFLESPAVELSIGLLIFLNVIVMAFEMQYIGLMNGYVVQYRDYDYPNYVVWPGGDVVFPALDWMFNIIFCLDVGARLVVLNVKFVKGWMNWLDLVVVSLSMMEATLGSLIIDPIVLRLLRLGKLSRGLRLVKMSKYLASLQLLLKCIASSWSMLFYSFTIFTVIQCVAAMALSMSLGGWLSDESVDIESRRKVFRFFGTFTKSMLTMFEVLFANWAPSCRTLIDEVSESYALFFIFYRCMVGFAVLNVVNSVFVQQTMKCAQEDHELMTSLQQKAKLKMARELRALFDRLDASGDGLVSWEEMESMLHDEGMNKWMTALEIEVRDLKNLFQILADDDGQMTVEDFLNGAPRLKGPAKSYDLAVLIAMVKRMDSKIETLERANGIADTGWHQQDVHHRTEAVNNGHSHSHDTH